MAKPGKINPCVWILLIALSAFWPSALAGAKVPAHVYPDEKSPVIAYIEIDPEGVNPRVLDPRYDGDWYWSTWNSSFYGYVGNSRVRRNGTLDIGAPIRMNPTRDSWILTRYEKGDKVRVTSRLSVSRVSIDKEIPVYYRLPSSPDSGGIAAVPVSPGLAAPEIEITEEEIAVPAIPGLPAESATVTPTLEDPQPQSESEAETGIASESSASPTTPDSVTEASFPAEDAAPTPTEEPVAWPFAPEEPSEPLPQAPEADHSQESLFPGEESTPDAISPEPSEPLDPVLEEAPLMSAQDLANLAPPSIDLLRDFQGYLRAVKTEDPQSAHFRYTLETRSGRRIVYLEVKNLRHPSFDQLVDEWINVKGLLTELPPDNVLYLDARNIRKEP